MGLLMVLAGCTPSGPRALLEGKRLIESGQYPRAIEKLKTATTLLGGTNAMAWEYLGLAYQYSGAVSEAEWAYQRALALNHDLSEVRFNLGCLWLAQNKLEAARGEFTAYTLRRPTAAEGFIKLGTMQLRAREPSAAERSFSEALRLSPQNPEALNGQGLAKLQRNHPAEAVQCFESALKRQPDYRPALLNLAVVAQEYLRDRQLALQKYREYAALKPPPANADALATIVRQLEQELNPPARHPVTNVVSPVTPTAGPPKPAAANVTRKVSAPKPEAAAPMTRPAATNLPKPEPPAVVLKSAATNGPKQAPAPRTPPTATAEVARPFAEPAPTGTQVTAKATSPSPAPPAGAAPTPPSGSTNAAAPTVAKRSFFERINPLNLFRSTDKTPIRPTPLDNPAPSPQKEPPTAGPVAAEHADTSTPAPTPTGPPGRDAYKSPPSPTPGNHEEAERFFAQGAQAYQAHRLREAMQAYQRATQADPSLYEAHYNLGLVATEAGDLTLALTAYEKALAIRPASLDARYNHALVLKQANHPGDAAHELEQVLAINPNETRANLALGNLYAQQFGQPAKARQYYLKVLQVEPQHPQASAIGYWLAAHPP